MFIYQMRSRKIYFSLVIALLFFATAFLAVRAEENKIDYNEQPIVDSDLDGLTDQAEIQVYGTDYKNADTDDDGIMDGVEVVNGSSPLDSVDPILPSIASTQETPWAWYVARSAGLVGFISLWLTIFLGLSIRNPLLKKIIEPIYSFDFHCFTAAMAVFLIFIHATSLLFDQAIFFGIKDIAIPFFANTTAVNSNFLALGIMASYAMVVMTITSYLRQHINHWLWRALHFLNPLAFIFVVIHGYQIGTDMKNMYIGGTYLASSALLGLIYFSSLVFVIINKFKRKNEYSN